MGAAVALLVTLTLTACMSPAPTPDHAPPRAGADFHLDCSAAADGDGSPSRPWNSPDRVAARGPFAPGDRILLARGSRCTGRLVPTGSGTNGTPIVLAAYGRGADPIVDGGATPDQTGTVELNGVHDWVVQDLVVTNLDPSGPDNTLRAGILVVNDDEAALSGIVIRRNTVRSVTSSPGSYTADPHEYGGIVVLNRSKSAASGIDGVRVENNVVDSVGRTGIVVWSAAWPDRPMHDVSVTGNEVLRAEGDSIILWGVDGGVIDHNTSRDGGHLPACPRCTSTALNTANAGIWPVSSRQILVRYNEVSGEGAAGGDGEGFDVDDSTEDVVLQGNYAHDNDGGGVLICGARRADIRFNVFERDRGGEIVFSCPTQRDGVRILNNVLTTGATTGAAVVRHMVTSGTEPIVFANNVVVNGDGGGYDWPSPVQATSNLFLGQHPPTEPADPSAIRDGVGLIAPGTGGTGIDSVLGSALAPGSSAVGSGAAVLPPDTTDYLGRPVDVGRPDRGAFSSTATAEVDPGPSRLTAARSASDVELGWPVVSGRAWVLERSLDGGPFVPITGQVLRGAYVDQDVPAGTLRYRLIAVGRNVRWPVASARVGGR